MKSGRSLIYLLLVAAQALSVPAAVRSQQEGDVPPKPAAHSTVLLGQENQKDQVTDQDVTTVRPDYRPLTGIQDITTGSPEVLHNYWMPGASYFNAI